METFAVLDDVQEAVERASLRHPELIGVKVLEEDSNQANAEQRRAVMKADYYGETVFFGVEIIYMGGWPASSSKYDFYVVGNPATVLHRSKGKLWDHMDVNRR